MNISDTRRENLRQLFTTHGGPKALAERLRYRTPSFMTQMAGPSPTREVSEKTARAFEARLELPTGWFDTPHEPATAEKAPAASPDIAALYLRVETAVRKSGVQITPEKFARLLAFAAANPDADIAALVGLVV